MTPPVSAAVPAAPPVSFNPALPLLPASPALPLADSPELPASLLPLLPASPLSPACPALPAAPAIPSIFGAAASDVPASVLTLDHSPQVGSLLVFAWHAVVTATPKMSPACSLSHTALGSSISPFFSLQPPPSVPTSASNGTRQASGPQIPSLSGGRTSARLTWSLSALESTAMLHACRSISVT